MTAEIITQKSLKEILHYDPETGIFTWRISKSSRAQSGSEAGNLRPDGYIGIRIDRRQYFAHRLAFLYMEGEMPIQVDHDNHIRNDNRWKNLNKATAAKNHKNESMQHNNTSGCTGVSWYKPTEKWMAQIRANGRRKYLGYYKDKDDAIIARKEAEKKYGYHKNHGVCND